MARFLVFALEFAALVAAVYYASMWYRVPGGNYEAAVVLAASLAGFAEWGRRQLRSTVDPEELAAFITRGQALLARKNEAPLPVAETNEWIGDIETYLVKQGRSDYKVRLSDFSGLQFYGDGSERSRFTIAIDGRLRRLHEFLRELSGEGK